MLQPFQSLLHCPKSSNGRSSVLLAASGPFIHSFRAFDGSFFSSWPNQIIEKPPDFQAESATSPEDSGVAEHERPSKRRKISLPGEASSCAPAEILRETQTETGSIRTIQASHADVSKLICNSDGSHVIAVTGEDKAVRVFQLLEDGTLVQTSERHALYIATTSSAH